jgi:hypothetical protein
VARAAGQAGQQAGQRAVQRAPSPEPQQPGPSAPHAAEDEATALRELRALEEALRGRLEDQHLRAHAPELTGWAAAPEHARPYRTMTDRGHLWKRARAAHGPQAPEGRAFIGEQSQRNMTAMTAEIGHPGDWHRAMFRELHTALSRMVLHHYTNHHHIERMYHDYPHNAVLKSKDRLAEDHPGFAFRHNTSPEDETDLGNTGFVFFFLARPHEPFRPTRFSEGGHPARLTVPMDTLVRDGWVMLNDFLEQEYPTLRSDARGDLLRYKRNALEAPEEKMEDFRWDAEEFWPKDGAGADRAIADAAHRIAHSLAADPDTPPVRDIVAILEGRKEADRLFEARYRKTYTAARREYERNAAESARFDRQVRRFDPEPQGTPGDLMGGVLRYVHGSGTVGGSGILVNHLVQRYREHLSGNILAGPHILRGLAARGVLEVARIEAAGGNEALVHRLKAMTGDELADVLLRDFVRPQAMIPWAVALGRGAWELGPT